MKKMYKISRTALKHKKVKAATLKISGSKPESRDASALVSVLKKIHF